MIKYVWVLNKLALLLTIVNGVLVNQDQHSLELFIDGNPLVLKYSETDDFHSLASTFALENKLDQLQSGCSQEYKSDRLACVVEKVVSAMHNIMASTIASEASIGKRFFDVTPQTLRSVVVVDNFLQHPHALREFGLSSEFPYKGNHPGMRSASFANMLAFRPIRREVEKLVGEKLPYWFASFQRSYSNDTDNGIHRDYPTYKYSALLYLNPESPHALGTSTYMHKETKIYEYPSEEYAAQHNTTTRLLLDKLESNMGEDKFEEIDRLGNRFNRLVLFNSKLNHRSASLGGQGEDSIRSARLALICFFNTEDKIGQAGSVLWYDDDSL
jgi:hypothetical protein